VRRVSSIRGGQREVELFTIGVDPERGGRGIGQTLIRGFLEESARRGGDSVYLTTDAEENERVNAFYRKLGFTLEKTYHHGPRRMCLYRMPLGSPAAGAAGEAG
jgi:ribosomal protein S18 acetylase RimI-like enzyme